MLAVAKGDKAFWSELARRIAAQLTPTTSDEVLMQSSTLVRKITAWIKELDPTYTGEQAKTDYSPLT
ncbi:hypothetical protein CDES_07065 [Corynebacterium deserti GIMN1.010]|uniref:Uncharacterized protein n=1 Tax=Corynebacterium deserti GIMN1.010 TaxID=931089 RepID=A0A0M4CJC0_9CORY|nr:hypothetical protein [Corynebacterium deserti]ALC05826.1 hypothetical protein CDES_07065 [Corynebacterium deserti GIMN1.010]